MKRHPDGFGFFIPEDREHPDVYVPRNSMMGAMTLDKVMIQVFPEQGGQRFRGDIVKILSRAIKTVVGVYRILNDKQGLVKDEGGSWGQDIRIDIEHSMKATNGQLVAVEITTYPDGNEKLTGKIVSIIGHSEDPLTDIKRILFQHHIPHEFTGSTEAESKQFSEHVPEKDLHNRKDLRALPFITIDGATAKDFDDAIYVQSHHLGFNLKVAIADVSHYVRPGMAIDQDAYERGTSVYFPNFVVPMLPEVLSNGLCSLNPHLPRLALVADIQMDFTGEMTSTEFYEAVIESKARVTYGQAQEVIDGNSVEKLKHVENEIRVAADLAKILMAKRFKDGALDLEIPEVQIVIDAAGIPVDFIRSERLFAHKLIEEMMLSANVAVAKFLTSREIPAIYRIHEPPHLDAIDTLNTYLNKFGSKVKISEGKLQKRLTRALQEFAGKPEAQILNILTLRSMSQAKYSSNNVGHFGLGFEDYTHFTSPIRRYPDLIVHRLLKSQIMKSSEYRLMGQDELDEAATMLSACEQRSVKAERQFQSIKKARFMQQHMGQIFEGMISSVTKFGVFVLLREYEVDGLVRLESLSKEKLIFDEENLILRGQRSGIIFQIGDQVMIQVAAADPDAGQVDFVLVHENAPQQDLKYDSKREKSYARSAGGRKPFRKEKNNDRSREKSHDKPLSKRKGSDTTANKEFSRSKKMQVADRIEKERPNKNVEPEDVVFSFLSNKQEESKSKGQKFDPEKHLREMMQKWKERNGDNWKINDRRKARPDRRGEDRRKSLANSNENEESSNTSSTSDKRFSRNKSAEKKNSKSSGRSFSSRGPSANSDDSRNESRNKTRDNNREKDDKKEGGKKSSFFGKFSGKKNKNKGRRS